jgi:uncharacterized protein (TIGR04255 family)
MPGPAPVHLDRAPLIRVLCQVQWPEHTLLSTRFASIANDLAARIAGDYPLSAAQPTSFEFDPATGQVRAQAQSAVRQWTSADDVWGVYFAPTFVTVENRGAYTNRRDLLDRFRAVVAQVASVIELPIAQRLGWRYVNRVSDDSDRAELNQLVEPTVLGAGAVPAPDHVELVHSFTESLFRSVDGNLLAKWGFLPPNATHDPTLPSAMEMSWILDIDAFKEERTAFDAKELTVGLEKLAELAYGFFRWSVKDSFIERFGGYSDHNA